MKQAVASSSTNIYHRKSTLFGPNGSSPAPAWPKPSPNHSLQICELGNPEIWNPTKISKLKILKIQIHVAQNVGNIWISWKKNPGLISCHVMAFCHVHIKTNICHLIFSLVGQWALFILFGPLLLSTRGCNR